LKNMDTSGRGYLTNEKVYGLMEEWVGSWQPYSLVLFYIGSFIRYFFRYL
jgi:hypothetical protein